MVDKSLAFAFYGRDRGAGSTMEQLGGKATGAHDALGKLGSTLTGLDGPFGQVQQLTGQLGDSIDVLQQRGKSLTTVMTGVGLGVTAVGVALIGFASKDQQAQSQLKQTVDNTGESYGDYAKRVDEVIHTQEGFAHTADDTENALNTLTTANQDVTASLNEMNLVSDIAAKKRENLAAAAQQLVLMESGNSRAFRSFGITLDSSKDKTVAVDEALKELTDRLHGQAPASVDTFTGKLKVFGVTIEDDLAKLGKYGPEITAVGAILTTAAAVTQILAARKLAEAVATDVETKAELGNAAARTAAAEAATVEAAAITRANLAQAEGGAAGALGGLGGAAGMLGTAGLIGRLGRGGLYGIAGLAAGQVAKSVHGSAGSVLGDVATGAGIGAGIGALGLPIPIVGEVTTAGGALIGGGLGLAKGLWGIFSQHNQDSAAAKKAADANQAYAHALIQEKSAAAQAALSIKGQTDALQQSAGKAMTLSSAQDDLQAAIHAMAQAAHDGTDQLKGHSLAAEANRNAVRDAVQKYFDFIKAQEDAGVHGEKLRQVQIQMATALEHTATEIFGNKQQVDGLLGSLGVLPGQVRRSVVSLQSLPEELGQSFTAVANAAFGWGGETFTNFERGWQLAQGQGSGANSPFLDPGHPGYADPKKSKTNAHDYGQQIAQQVIDGYAPAVDTGVSKSTSAALNKAKQHLQQMAQLEKTTFQEVANYYKQTRDQIVSAFDVANPPQRTDTLGGSFGFTSPKKAAHQFVRDLTTWANLYHRLEGKLNPVMLDQLEQAGIDAIPAMQEILRDHEIGALNRDEKRIQHIAGGIASTQTADTFEAKLARVMEQLPDKLARELRRELRHLHIEVHLKTLGHHRARRIRSKS